MKKLIDRYFIKKPKVRRWVTRFLEGDKDVNVQLLGASLKINSLKEHGYLRASRFSAASDLLGYEVSVMMNLASLLLAGDTFVDIGANVGIYSACLGRIRRIQPNLNFYAFEANPDTYSRLTENVHPIGVKTQQIAISSFNGVIEFVAGAVSHVFTTVDRQNAYSIPEEKTSVPCRTLDSLDFEGNSLVLKIDVEGQELDVLQGGKLLFAANRVRAVYLDGYNDEGVIEFLQRHHFSFYDGRTLEPASAKIFHLLAIRQGDAS